MSWMKGKSSGWTAFDLKQRQRQQGLQSEIKDDDPFPPVSTSVNPPHLDVIRGKLVRRNHEPSEKSFSSVLLPPPKFPALTESKDWRSKPSPLLTPTSHHDSSAFSKLKEMNSWADDSLIRDILLSTEDNFEMALAFLQGMAYEEAEVPTNRQSEHRISGRTVTSSVNIDARSTLWADGLHLITWAFALLSKILKLMNG